MAMCTFSGALGWRVLYTLNPPGGAQNWFSPPSPSPPLLQQQQQHWLIPRRREFFGNNNSNINRRWGVVGWGIIELVTRPTPTTMMMAMTMAMTTKMMIFCDVRGHPDDRNDCGRGHSRSQTAYQISAPKADCSASLIISEWGGRATNYMPA